MKRRPYNRLFFLFFSALQSLVFAVALSAGLAVLWPQAPGLEASLLAWFFPLFAPVMVIGTIAGARWNQRAHTIELESPQTERAPLWTATPDQRRQAWALAREDLRRYLRSCLMVSLLSAVIVSWAAWRTNPSLAAALPTLLRTFMTIFVPGSALITAGTLVSHLSDLLSATAKDRAITQARRERSEGSELGGSLEVAAPSSSGDLYVTAEAGSLDAHDEVILDFEPAQVEQAEEVVIPSEHAL